jgi:fatty acid desaturase
MEDWIDRDAPADLLPPGRLRALGALSDIEGWTQTASHLTAILFTGTLLAAGGGRIWPGAFAAVFVVHGVLLNSLSAGQHELAHGTVFRTAWLNDAFGQLFGFVTVDPFHTDRWAHLAHHREARNPGRDPELIGRPPPTVAGHVLELIGVTFWRRRLLAILRSALGRATLAEEWLEPGEARLAVLEARAHLALWMIVTGASMLAQSWLAVTLWIGPLLLTSAFRQLRVTGEHTGLPEAPDVLARARTLEGPPWLRWLMWNTGWHAAHHAYPTVPFHALPALHQEIADRRDPPLVRTGYLQAQREIFAWLRARGGAPRTGGQ